MTNTPTVAGVTAVEWRPATAVVEVAALSKRFGATRVLDGVDLRVPPGTILALLGPSGCGKTTLLRAIAGLEVPDAGEVRLHGRLLSGPPPARGARPGGCAVLVPPERRGIGMVFQDWALFPHMSVGRNVAFGLPRGQRRGRRVEQALALVGLDGFADRDPTRLSGGQRQRVALARALATRPALLLLDEPFSNLDAGLRVQVRGEVQRLLADLGMTAVFVTHDQEEAFVVGGRVAVMLGGRIAQQGTPAELYDAPVSRAVAEFVGDPNILPGAAEGDRAATAVGQVPLRAPGHGDVDVLVRPECLAITAGDQASVEAVEYYGHDTVYLARRDAGPLLRVRVLAAPRYRRGDRVAVGYAGGPTVAFGRQ
jgi:iron(III) transport system ATP-binding protein